MHRIAHIYAGVPRPPPVLPPFHSLSRRSPSISLPRSFSPPLALLPILALPSASPCPTSLDIVTFFPRPPSLARSLIPLGVFLSFLSLDQVPAYYVTLLPRATIFNPETRSNCELSVCTCTCTIIVVPSMLLLPPSSPSLLSRCLPRHSEKDKGQSRRM